MRPTGRHRAATAPSSPASMRPKTAILRAHAGAHMQRCTSRSRSHGEDVLIGHLKLPAARPSAPTPPAHCTCAWWIGRVEGGGNWVVLPDGRISAAAASGRRCCAMPAAPGADRCASLRAEAYELKVARAPVEDADRPAEHAAQVREVRDSCLPAGEPQEQLDQRVEGDEQPRRQRDRDGNNEQALAREVPAEGEQYAEYPARGAQRPARPHPGRLYGQLREPAASTQMKKNTRKRRPPQ